MSECSLKLVDYNYPFLDNISITASSANPSFPVSNLSTYPRSKVWRSSGNFVIDATNNKLDFKESAIGSELTATITTGSFTPDELATEIKNRMENAGAETYTVAYNANGTWTISTGGAFLSILNSTGTNTATSIGPSIGMAVSDYTGATSYVTGVAIHTEESVVFDLKTAENINVIALFFDPRDGIRYSDQAVLKIQANATNEWSSPAVDQALTIDNDFLVVSHVFATDQHYRYWRLKIVDSKNNDLYIQLGSVILGKTKTTTRVPSKGFKYKKIDNTKLFTNDYGNVYADIYPKKRTLEFDFSVLPKADLELLESIYDRVGTHTPLLFSIDYDESMFDKHQFFLYGHFTSGLDSSHVFHQYMNASMSIEEFF